MPPTSSLDPRWPVLVGVGQVEQRTDDVHAALSPDALLAEAARVAQTDSGAGGLLGAVDTVAVIRILSWRYQDPGALVAGHLGITPRRTIVTDDGGNYPQTLLNRACLAILDGSSDAVLIGGAETWRTRSRHKAAELTPDWPRQEASVAPTEVLANKADLWHPGEWARRVMMPIEFYPLFENAHRAAEGWTIPDHRDRVAALWSRFSEVAATNPHAWIRRTFTPAEIRDPSPDNRMVGFPYTKLMNANNAVEQAAAFVVCSVAKAIELGVPTDRWVFPWSGTDAHEHWHVSSRWSLAEAPAIRLAGRRALELAGVGVDDLAHVDVYSCFPSAVQIAAKEIGLGTDRAAHGHRRPVVRRWAVERLREPLHRHHGGPPAGRRRRGRAGHGQRRVPHQARLRGVQHHPSPGRLPPRRPAGRGRRPPVATARRARRPAADGEVVVETSTVMHDRASNPERAILSTLLADGRRAWGGSTDPAVLRELTTVETAGRTGTVDAEGTFTFTELARRAESAPPARQGVTPGSPSTATANAPTTMARVAAMSAASVSTQLKALATISATPARMMSAPMRVVTGPAWRATHPPYNRRSCSVTDPSRRMRQRTSVASTTVDATVPAGPPSTTSPTGPARAAAASRAVVGVGSPCRLALVVAIGPTRAARARTKSESGQRRPTVASDPPRASHAASTERGRTSVSAPGQSRSIHRATSAVTARGSTRARA
jgi:acetyl-CoA C-acetyltransferase